MDRGQTTGAVELNVEKSPQELELLGHIREVNERRLELGHECSQLHSKGDVDGSVRKKRAAEEARRYLNRLVARHKKLYRRRPPHL